MRKLLFIFTIALTSALAINQATGRTISWINPTTYTNNTPIDNTAAIYAEFYYGLSADGPWTYFYTSNYGDNTMTIDTLPCGPCWYSVVAIDNSCLFASQFDNAVTYPLNRAAILDNVCYMSNTDNNIGNSPSDNSWSAIETGLYSGFSPGYAYLLLSPTLTLPIDNAVVSLIVPVTFTWEVFTGSVGFQIQVDDNSNFSSPEVDVFIDCQGTCDTDDAQYEASPGELDSGTHYYWRVRALR
jgi:hypothetical protein